MSTSEVQAVVLAALDDVVATCSASQVLALRDALMGLERTGVPVVIWSERTRAEIELLRERLGATAPFISEDGSALFVPSAHVHFPVEANRTVAGYGIVEFGLRYDQVVAVLSRVAQSVGIRLTRLTEMTIEDVARQLRISLVGARLVKLREYGELFRIEDEKAASRGRLFRALRAAGLSPWHGTPFDYVSGLADKRVAIDRVRALLATTGRRVMMIGIGSRPRHLPVLHAADVRIIVHEGDPAATTQLLSQAPLAHVVETPGAGGLIEAVTRVQSRLGMSSESGVSR